MFAPRFDPARKERELTLELALVRGEEERSDVRAGECIASEESRAVDEDRVAWRKCGPLTGLEAYRRRPNPHPAAAAFLARGAHRTHDPRWAPPLRPLLSLLLVLLVLLLALLLVLLLALLLVLLLLTLGMLLLRL